MCWKVVFRDSGYREKIFKIFREEKKVLKIKFLRENIKMTKTVSLPFIVYRKDFYIGGKAATEISVKQPIL